MTKKVFPSSRETSVIGCSTPRLAASTIAEGRRVAIVKVRFCPAPENEWLMVKNTSKKWHTVECENRSAKIAQELQSAQTLRRRLPQSS